MLPFRQVVRSGFPWAPLAVCAVAAVIQANDSWRDALIYRRTSLEEGQLWRLWTGHLVHFGWPHFLADAGLLLILGWAMRNDYRWFKALAFVLMPAFISVAIYAFDPAMQRYGGLSAINLAMLLYVAIHGWQRKWTDWFWPAVLAIYVGEVIYETVKGGQGGGMIPFDDASVKVATGAHIAGAAYALFAWLLARRMFGRSQKLSPSALPSATID